LYRLLRLSLLLRLLPRLLRLLLGRLPLRGGGCRLLRLPEVRCHALEVENTATATWGRRGQETQLLTKELPVKLLL
jgi:hypothetical protein